jgi:hypothetical protein
MSSKVWDNDYEFDPFSPSIIAQFTGNLVFSSDTTLPANAPPNPVACVCPDDSNLPTTCQRAVSMENTCPANTVMIEGTGQIIQTTSEGCNNGCVYCAISCEPISGLNVSCQVIPTRCVDMNGPASCLLGTKGTGNCAGGTCQYHSNWDLNSGSITSGTSGWAACTYGYDFSQYKTSNLQDLYYWLSDVYAGFNGFNIQNRIRDGNYMYAALTDIYNQMYGFGPYANSAPSNWLQTDFIAAFPNYIHGEIGPLNSLFESLYPNNTIPTDLVNMLTYLLRLPTPAQNGDTYTLTLYINSLQYQALKNSAAPLVLLNSWLNAFLQDGSSKVTINGIQKIPSNAQISAYTIDYLTPFQVQDYNGNTSYMVVLTSESDFLNEPQYGKTGTYTFGIAAVTVTISAWSPILLAFFQSFLAGVTFSSNASSTIQSQTGFIPMANFQSLISSINTITPTLQTYCAIVYDPPPNMPSVTDYLPNQVTTQACQCYYSTLPSPLESGPNNSAAICYDNTCTDNMRTLLGLTDTNCMKYCSQVWNWLSAQNVENRSVNPHRLDNIRYKSLCGQSYAPPMPANYNWPALGFGIGFSVLICLILFALLRYMELDLDISTTLVTLILIILVAFFGFLGRDFAGIGVCENSSSKCQSRISKKYIPDLFCSYMPNCECSIDSDCNLDGNCTCVNGICQPINGARFAQVVTESDPLWPLVITSITLAVILPLALYLMYQDDHWPISDITLLIICIGASSVLIIIAVLFYLHKKRVIQYLGSC